MHRLAVCENSHGRTSAISRTTVDDGNTVCALDSQYEDNGNALLLVIHGGLATLRPTAVPGLRCMAAFNPCRAGMSSSRPQRTPSTELDACARGERRTRQTGRIHLSTTDESDRRPGGPTSEMRCAGCSDTYMDEHTDDPNERRRDLDRCLRSKTGSLESGIWMGRVAPMSGRRPGSRGRWSERGRSFAIEEFSRRGDAWAPAAFIRNERGLQDSGRRVTPGLAEGGNQASEAQAERRRQMEGNESGERVRVLGVE